MNPKITEVIDKIEAATIRERCLVLLSCIAVVYLLWDFTLYTPISNQKVRLDKELSEQKNNIETLKKEEKMLMLSLANDPNRELKTLLDSMSKRKDSLEKNLDALSDGLVRVEKLSLILQEVLKKTDNLTLESLKTLPVKELKLDELSSANKKIVEQSRVQNRKLNEKTNNAKDDIEQAGVYKHGISLIVKGTYFQLLDYLHKLENMSSRFYWEELRYEQDDYPKGYFHLKVYTLTRAEGFSGV